MRVLPIPARVILSYARALSMSSPQASSSLCCGSCASYKWRQLLNKHSVLAFASSCTRSSPEILSEEVAARSDGLATVRGARAARCPRGPGIHGRGDFAAFV